MNKAFSFLTAAALCLSLSANAQKADRDYSSAHNFIGVQGGGQVTFTHYKLTDLLTPQYAVQFGRYFNDKVGARLHVMGWQNKGGFKASRFNLQNDVDYKFKAITGDLDLLMNMTNIISPKRASHAFDWVLLAGFGVNYGWDFDEYENITKSFTALNATYPQNCGTKHASYNGRLGTQLNWNVCDAFTIGLELQANYKNDMYNLKVNNNPDWQAAALLGLTYNFGYKKKAPKQVEPVYETRLDTTWYNETVYKKVTEEETLRRDIFFSQLRQQPQGCQGRGHRLCRQGHGQRQGQHEVLAPACRGRGRRARQGRCRQVRHHHRVQGRHRPAVCRERPQPRHCHRGHRQGRERQA